MLLYIISLSGQCSMVSFNDFKFALIWILCYLIPMWSQLNCVTRSHLKLGIVNIYFRRLLCALKWPSPLPTTQCLFKREQLLLLFLKYRLYLYICMCFVSNVLKVINILHFCLSICKLKCSTMEFSQVWTSSGPGNCASPWDS